MTKPEILAPAGNLFKLKTAVRYGADAVYVAGQKFGLRSGADNFTSAEIRLGCDYAHAHGARVYVVLNGFLFDEDLAELPAFLSELEEAAVDAVIVSDLGVVETVRRHSRLPIHLSTQASTLNTYSARFWKSQGIARIVLGREVSLAAAARIKRDAGMAVEVFGHGALCMAYSGNCTISNYTAGRDSNRGGCVQSCRFKYTLASQPKDAGPTASFFSSKDLQGVAYIDEFRRLGIDSLKIEGRMKSALYVATTVRAYVGARAAAAATAGISGQGPIADFIEELNTMSHRDYTSGSLSQPAGPDSVFHADQDETANTHDLLGHVLELEPGSHTAILLKNPLHAGEPVELLARDGRTYRIASDRLRDLGGRPIGAAHPNQVVLLEPNPRAEPDLLLRKPKDAQTHRKPAAVN